MSGGPKLWWKPREWALAQRLRDAGKSYAEIADDLDTTEKRVMMKFNNEAVRLRRQSGTVLSRPGDPSPKALIERAKRQDAPRSLTALLCGDPAPGQSALDKKRRSGAAP